MATDTRIPVGRFASGGSVANGVPQANAITRIVGEPDGVFLAGLGARVRELRNRCGMTRKMLAREADVSERHLAQLEVGEGNVSIVLLRRIAVAVNASLAELFATRAVEESDGKQAIQRFLERLPRHRVEEVVSRLQHEFGDEEKARRMRTALIGLRGAGKSTLGSKLAAETGVAFIELDREIEKDSGMPLADIFSLYGQAGYRAIEKRTLEKVIGANESAVLSVGGGMVSEKDTYDYLLANCYTIWVKAAPEEHMSRVMAQGDFRAMAGSDQAMEDLRRILAAREPLYRKADRSLDNSGSSVEESFAKLKAMVATQA
ncbi:MAG TPA: helix-turn-helix transcriptional regulator [Candidatus Acidoferrum sp.]|jgi:XRE family aerobic/anaerobic benzoate catabolism transcriptional regulator